MNSINNRRIVLATRPKGAPTNANFRIEDTLLPDLKDGQILLKTLYFSLDPYMRGRMDAGESYAPPVEVNEVMGGEIVARVVESHHPEFSSGDIVVAYSGWQSFTVSDGNFLRKLDPKQAPISTALGVLGMPGFTAYAGLLTIGQPKPSETVVVAAASGPVGSAVGQIARIKGARAVGIVGGPEKLAYVRDELKFDAVIDHRAKDFPDQLKQACPNGIDVYFENVGGAVWDAVFPLLNLYARIPVCGLIAFYNGLSTPTNHDRLPLLMRKILVKSLTIRGFIQSEFINQRGEFYKQMASWINARQVRYREDIIDGLENAPDAFIGMLNGRNFGKLLIRVAPE